MKSDNGFVFIFGVVQPLKDLGEFISPVLSVITLLFI
jgi:hypothetical protein